MFVSELCFEGLTIHCTLHIIANSTMKLFKSKTDTRGVGRLAMDQAAVFVYWGWECVVRSGNHHLDIQLSLTVWEHFDPPHCFTASLNDFLSLYYSILNCMGNRAHHTKLRRIEGLEPAVSHRWETILRTYSKLNPHCPPPFPTVL